MLLWNFFALGIILLLIPHIEQPFPKNLPKKVCLSISHEKLFLENYGGLNMLFLYWKIMWGYALH